MSLLVGCDPEVFLAKDGVPFSAHGIVPGDKRNPHPVRCGAVQVDGMAAEFNITPSQNASLFSHRIQTVLGGLEKRIREHGLEFYIKPSATFPRDHYDEQPDDAKELGCDPDYNAYTGEVNPRPDPGDRPFRTAAGHVHLGWTEGAETDSINHMQDCREMIAQLDWYLGLPSLLFDDDHDRRTLYGAAGAFRPKPYGCEYRVLSNAWLRHPELMKWVFNSTKLAFNQLKKGNAIVNKWGAAGDFINNSRNFQREHILVLLEDTGVPLPPDVELQ